MSQIEPSQGGNMIFVFGSNLAGRHGKGAARYARAHFAAEYGVGEGRTGNAYAIPTKDHNLKILSLESIDVSIAKFCNYAKGRWMTQFLLTPIGTGLAGYSHQQILQLFQKHGVPYNVFLANSWANDWKG